MQTYNIAKLKNELSQALSRVTQGEELVVMDHNRPVARILPLKAVPPLPDVDLRDFFRKAPLELRKKTTPSAKLIRQIRDEDTH